MFRHPSDTVQATGRALLTSTALAAVLSGLLAAVEGSPSAALLGVAAGAGLAALGRGLGRTIRDAQAS